MNPDTATDLPAEADEVWTNAVIHTAVPNARPAGAMAFGGGRILAVGTETAVGAHRGRGTATRDLRGAFVMPGFVDVHNHHATAGRRDLLEMGFSPSLGLAAILDLVHARAGRLTPGAWLTGGIWGSTLVPALSRRESLHALDRAGGGHPVMLTDDSHHSRWVNSVVLESAGITAATPDPPGGVIVRDADGTPTGLLLEAAGLLAESVARKQNPMTPERHRQVSQHAIGMLHGYGVTAFQDAGVSVDILRALKELDEAGQLECWVVSCLLINDPVFGYQPIGAELIECAQQFRSPHHRPDFVKIFLDGVPPSRTAAFLQPYLPDTLHGNDFRGRLAMTPDELTGWLRTAAGRGLSAKVHCTGDASVRAVLDAVAQLRREGHLSTGYQIAHGQFIHPDDVPRFAELGVASDISPFIWFPGEIPDALGAVLPAELAGHIQPVRTLLETGAVVAGGSDWPVCETPNPWEGIAGLVTRRDPRHRRDGALWPEQAVGLDQAIGIFTIGAARASGLADVAGSLSPGKSADAIVLDRNPFTVDPDRIADTAVLETVFEGRTVFQRA